MKRHLLIIAMLAMAVCAFAWTGRSIYTQIVLENLDILDYISNEAWPNLGDGQHDPNWYFEVSCPEIGETGSTETHPGNRIKVGKFQVGGASQPMRAWAFFDCQVFSPLGPSAGKEIHMKLRYLPTGDEANFATRIRTLPSGVGPVLDYEGSTPPMQWVLPDALVGTPAPPQINFTVRSNYVGAAIHKDGVDTGETTPWTFIGPTAEVAGVYTVVRDATTFVVQGTTDTSYNYDGAADATVTFIGTYTPAIAAGNPYPANGANFDIAHDAVATTYDLTWEAPIAGDVDGYKIVWNGGNPIDVGNDLTWTTPAIAEGTYTWMVIPYINDPLPPVPAPGGKTTGFTREFAPLQAKLIAPQTKGDAVNTPTWSFTVTRQDPPVLPVELSNFSAVLTAENFVKLSWRTQSETGMLGYRVYRGDSDVQASSMMLPVLIPANNTSNVIDYTWVDSEVEVQHTYWYWLEAVEVNGTGQFYGPLTVRVEGEIPSVLPTITTMGNAYPNPFKQSSSTTIDVSIKEGENGTVTVYNILGQIVKTFKVNEGEHQIHWNGKDARGNNCGSGIYFYKLSTPSTNVTKKMVIVK